MFEDDLFAMASSTGSMSLCFAPTRDPNGRTSGTDCYSNLDAARFRFALLSRTASYRPSFDICSRLTATSPVRRIITQCRPLLPITHGWAISLVNYRTLELWSSLTSYEERVARIPRISFKTGTYGHLQVRIFSIWEDRVAQLFKRTDASAYIYSK